MSRPANNEMVRGFNDGYDPNSPSPGPNTTASYRHGFECGRDDILNRHRFDCATLRKMADDAMDRDDDPWRSMNQLEHAI